MMIIMTVMAPLTTMMMMMLMMKRLTGIEADVGRETVVSISGGECGCR